ncbi:phenylacetic acid degradation operon negative regulatory protein PaaX [Bosea vaviloviae]|uniref:Phenylacetic acid degradation operon negative regulatory protein PaaX n=1 Tax=Bosea vaviloviae TaxID=1526658 RepID=A0A1D7U9K5_9HYPH|nr:phenylacetic acid degradation operon negative regulatory protein PaaX [Bosea vaviloviae]AOO84019.1 phenylacetic acid degradation operon negative regulatory protein PaaX [Bosea vaviloviae]
MSRATLDPILDHLRGEPSRTWSIIITIYGDAIVPRGGCVWLGTLLAFFRAMGLSDGLVRTAMSRLATDGWLERIKVGRNSFYRLADKGRDTFRHASEQIYTLHSPPWPGRFDVALFDGGADREGTKAAMETAGFGIASPGLWLAPAGAALPELANGALRFEAGGDLSTNRALAARSWPLDAIAEAYRRFQAAFEPLATGLEGGIRLSDLDALVARILLIHEYRRVVLRDPVLPADILPEDWPGASARSLCAAIYRQVLPSSERWLDQNASNESGEPLPRSSALESRFMT